MRFDRFGPDAAKTENVEAVGEACSCGGGAQSTSPVARRRDQVAELAVICLIAVEVNITDHLLVVHR